MSDTMNDKMERMESILWQFLSLDPEKQEAVLREAERITS